MRSEGSPRPLSRSLPPELWAPLQPQCPSRSLPLQSFSVPSTLNRFSMRFASCLDHHGIAHTGIFRSKKGPKAHFHDRIARAPFSNDYTFDQPSQITSSVQAPIATDMSTTVTTNRSASPSARYQSTLVSHFSVCSHFLTFRSVLARLAHLKRISSHGVLHLPCIKWIGRANSCLIP